MYYKSLEDFVNKLVYSRYVDVVLEPNKAVIINKNDKTAYKIFVSDKRKFYDSKNQCMKRTCEIGNLGFLLENINQETEFKAYLQTIFPSINIDSLIAFGRKLKGTAPFRNKAAHGNDIITYQEVCTDKIKVFSDNTEEYRGLILELLEILYS